MVALCAQTLAMAPVSCSAKAELRKARAELARKRFAAAGRRLLEAILQLLHAECQYRGCEPVEGNRRRLRSLLNALREAGELSANLESIFLAIAQTAKRATRRKFVPPAYLEAGIAIVGTLAESCPYLLDAEGGTR